MVSCGRCWRWPTRESRGAGPADRRRAIVPGEHRAARPGLAALPKRPYAIESERKTRLLGLPRERDFDLNAFYTDPSLLRDVLAHDAARRLGLATSRTRFVELWLSRRYRGVYLHQREDGKLALGPVWDFDLSSGNTVDPAISASEGWLLSGCPWAGALLEDPAFRAALAARWRTLRAGGLLEQLLATVDRHAAALQAPAERNFARWPTLGRPLFRNQPLPGSHPAAVAALKDWLIRRAAWMDAAL
jgi:CotH kinase protein